MGLLVIMGLGIASYHPEGYRAAASVAGSRKATAVSWFSVGGNIGIALGPPVITFLVVNFGLHGTMGMIVPAAVVATILSFASPRIAHQKRTLAVLNKDAKNRNGAMTLLVAVVTIRSWTQLGFATYIPFYYLDHLKASPEKVALLLFVFLGAGAAGTLVGGPLADRLGVRNVMIGAFLLSVPLGTLFLLTHGLLSYLLLGLYGAALVSTFTTSVVLGQAYLPRTPGMASGMIVGFALGTGGAAVTLFGRIADLYGVPVVLWICACLPLVGFAGALFLPQPALHPRR
jgi:FSR family fosmidomycin resistance protein-like MFS transporter